MQISDPLLRHVVQHWPILMPDAQHWVILLMSDIALHEPWMHSALSHMIIRYWAILWLRYQSTAVSRNDIDALLSQHWTTEPYWCLSHSIELFSCLMLCCIELSSLHLNWARKTRLWTLHMCKLHNMTPMVDGRMEESCMDFAVRFGFIDIYTISLMCIKTTISFITATVQTGPGAYN